MNNLQCFSKQTLQDILQKPETIYPLDKIKTYTKWPKPKPHPTPPLYGTQKTTYPYSQSTFCYRCQDTRKNLNHSTYNCPYTKCMKCKTEGHANSACIEINITLPECTAIIRKIQKNHNLQPFHPNDASNDQKTKIKQQQKYIPTEQDINNFLKTLRNKRIIQTPTKMNEQSPKGKIQTDPTDPITSLSTSKKKKKPNEPKILDVITLDSSPQKRPHTKANPKQQNANASKQSKNSNIPNLPKYIYKNMPGNNSKQHNRYKPGESLIPDLPKPIHTNNYGSHSQEHQIQENCNKPCNKHKPRSSLYNQGHLSDISSDDLISSDELPE